VIPASLEDAVDARLLRLRCHQPQFGLPLHTIIRREE